MRSILHLLLLVILAAACAAQTDSSGQLSNQQRFDPDRIDKALDPCNDFFEYACSKWLKANPIPGDQAGWGTLNVMNIWNTSAVRNTLEEAAAAPKPNPVEKKVGDYYASCMDESAVNKAGIAPLQPALDRIAALKSKDQMPELLAYIHQNIRPADLNYIDAQYGGVLFGIFSTPDFNDASLQLAALDQSGMGLPSRDFYLKDDEKSKKIRDQYLQYISKVLELSGEPAAQASSDSQTILSMETALANGAMDIILRRDPKNLNNRMSLEQLQQLTPSFNWSSYFAAMQAPTSPTYLVLAPDFYRGIEKLLASESVDHWRAYLRYSMLRMNASLLSQPFVDANFNFFSRTLFGAQQLPPRWRRCSNYADADLGEAVGQAYSAKYFPPASKARMLKMVHAIENALHADIDSRDWMSPETKKLAHAKLRAQVDKIGYPDQWRDYSTV
jgi:putative endopeptidase